MSAFGLYRSSFGELFPVIAALDIAVAGLLLGVAWILRARVLTPYNHLPCERCNFHPSFTRTDHSSAPPGLSLKHDHSSLSLGKPYGSTWREWFKTYGSTMLIRVAPYYRPVILTKDPSFIRHVFANINDFEGSPRFSKAFKLMGLNGALPGVHGERRQRIRAVYGRSASLAAMRAKFPQMLKVANKVKQEISQASEVVNGQPFNPAPHVIAFQMGILSKIVFGFTDEEIVNGKPKEFQDILAEYLKSRQSLRWWDLHTHRILPSGRWRKHQHNRRCIANFGKRVLREKQAKITGAFGHDLKVEEIDEMGDDIITSWCRYNMANDIPENQKISDEDLVDNVPLAIIATMDVSRLIDTEILHRLAISPDIQARLRDELSALPDEPSLEDLSKVKYLEAFIEEIVRINNPYTTIERTCTRTSVVPLRDPIQMSNGKTVDSITVHAGTDVSVAVYQVAQDESLYGSDPEAFRPERHLGGSCEKVDGGVALHAAWGSSVGFSGGGRGCPVYQFPLAFMRAFIFVMVRSFEISEPKDQNVEVWTHTVADIRQWKINGKVATYIPTIFTPIIQDE
ncbi:cytochrome P450 [Kockovaella imperatae]|uniref:Cytochrome P450 n=1 Tax=Kockovaella imperatae TaxID=4999 RepID=A0A1Y1U903_9TREE|nr:cytochrome P450 [Kockovaella imperatae]ORX34510.1 cytochrome P450 [Kockovaella imperatae]